MYTLARDVPSHLARTNRPLRSAYRLRRAELAIVRIRVTLSWRIGVDDGADVVELFVVIVEVDTVRAVVQTARTTSVSDGGQGRRVRARLAAKRQSARTQRVRAMSQRRLKMLLLARR